MLDCRRRERERKKTLVANFNVTITGKIGAIGLMTQNALVLSDQVKITLFTLLTGSLSHGEILCSDPELITFVLFLLNY